MSTRGETGETRIREEVSEQNRSQNPKGAATVSEKAREAGRLG